MDTHRSFSMTFALKLGAAALLLALIAFGGSAWLGYSGTAFAPEPARLVEDISGGNGATAAAVFISSNAPTTVVKWPATYVSVANPPAAGTPCTTGNLLYGDETRKTIQRAGSFARCF